jgi:hypothetical protein
MRALLVYFSGGTEVTIETSADPNQVFETLSGRADWLVVEDSQGERHYLAVNQIAYLTFGSKKGIGFA